MYGCAQIEKNGASSGSPHNALHSLVIWVGLPLYRRVVGRGCDVMCVVCVHVSLIKGLQTFTVCISKFRCKYLGIMCSSFTHTDNCVSIGKNSIGELFIIFTLQSLSHASVAGLRQLSLSQFDQFYQGGYLV